MHVMNQNQWRIGRLSEMPPEGKGLSLFAHPKEEVPM